MKILPSLLLILLCFSCSQEPTSDEGAVNNGPTIQAVATDSAAHGFPYQIMNADTTYILPGNLKELSGMQYISNSLVACIQDEKGILYMFDVAEGKLVREIHWGEEGDYEGVAGTNDVLYIMKSNGELYQLTDFNTDNTPLVASFNTGLDDCDAEGLCLSPNGDSLLIACKAGSYGVRHIFSLDLKTHVVADKPYMAIHQKVLEGNLLESGLDKFSVGMRKLLDAQGESGILAPSGIAVHPFTKDLYILSSQSKLMVVIGPAGEVKHIEELPVSLFLQPESITFMPNGDMLIGNEGQGGDPTIMLFKYAGRNPQRQ